MAEVAGARCSGGPASTVVEGPWPAAQAGSDDITTTDGHPSIDDPLGAVLAAVARGDEAAFATLYDELAPTVHGIVRRVLRDRAQAEEVTQEVFVELWRSAARHDRARGRVRAWAATIAHRRAVDRVRSEEAGRRRHERVPATAPPPDPTEGVLDRLDGDRVALALGQLTDLQRQAIELAYYDGRTYREVARLLDAPEGTVKARIRDGLIRLRDTLGVTA